MTRRHARATQAEIARAVRAAGPERVVEIMPDGKIRFVPLAQAGENPQLVKERIAVDREPVL